MSSLQLHAFAGLEFISLPYSAWEGLCFALCLLLQSAVLLAGLEFIYNSKPCQMSEA